MQHRRTLPFLLAAAAAALLTACSSGGDYCDLHRDARPGDELPAVAAGTDEAIVPATSRLVGTHEGSELYLMRAESDGVCLLVYPNDADWVLGCAGSGLGVDGFLVLRDGEMPPEGAVAVSQNVFAR